MHHPPVDHLKNLGSQGTEYRLAGPHKGQLETFESPARRDDSISELMVEIEFPEFTSLCPKTGQPDFASIVINYRPRRLCVESKSLKLYFFAYRNEGSFMEAIVQKILDDLVSVLDPLWMRVEGRFNPRGGTRLWPMAEYTAEAVD